MDARGILECLGEFLISEFLFDFNSTYIAYYDRRFA